MRSPRMPSSVELVARSRRVVHRVIHRFSETDRNGTILCFPGAVLCSSLFCPVFCSIGAYFLPSTH